MFAYAASHLDPRDGKAGDSVDPAGDYTRDARTILDTIYHESRSSTVQALILLGVREFGAGGCMPGGGYRALLLTIVNHHARTTGSLEEGWLHIGRFQQFAVLHKAYVYCCKAWLLGW